MADLDEEADFAIVGSGGGSMCAALACADLGLRPPILEKEPLVGGSTAMSGGIMWIPGNSVMAEAGVPDSPDLGLQYLESLVPEQPGSTLARKQAYMQTGPGMVGWLRGKGIIFGYRPARHAAGVNGSLRRDIVGLLLTHYARPHTEIPTVPEVAAVIERTLRTLPADATHWSIRSMAAAAGHSHTTIRRIWNAFGPQPHRAETFKLSSDPLFVDKVRDIHPPGSLLDENPGVNPGVVRRNPAQSHLRTIREKLIGNADFSARKIAMAFGPQWLHCSVVVNQSTGAGPCR